jgi:hypothetical protein
VITPDMMRFHIAGLVRSPVEHLALLEAALCCMSRALLRRHLVYRSFITWYVQIFRDIVYLLSVSFIKIHNPSPTVYF